MKHNSKCELTNKRIAMIPRMHLPIVSARIVGTSAIEIHCDHVMLVYQSPRSVARACTSRSQRRWRHFAPNGGRLNVSEYSRQPHGIEDRPRPGNPPHSSRNCPPDPGRESPELLAFLELTKGCSKYVGGRRKRQRMRFEDQIKLFHHRS